MPSFDYGQKEMDYLKRSDAKLGQAIERIGLIEREVNPDLFAALVQSVVAQQIAAKAAATVWQRVRDRFGAIIPEALAVASLTEIQQCGVSMRKAGYIQGIATAVLSGEARIHDLPELADAEIIKQLSVLPGIGVWTAEMLLIFALERPDVVSWGDLAIRRGMMALYGLTQLDKTQFARYRKRYSPYGSVASFYLWRLATEGNT